MEMKGKDGGGGGGGRYNPRVRFIRGDTKEKSGPEGFTQTPSRLSFSIHARLQPSTDAASRGYGRHEKKLNLTFLK